MALFDGKKGLILGVANDHSIAWAIAQEIMRQGGECGFTHLPDRDDDPRQRNRRRVQQLTDPCPLAKFLLPLDVQSDESIAQLMHATADVFGRVDFLLHSIAFADRADLGRPTIETSRAGFKLAMDVSVYSLIAVCHAARNVLQDGASIVTMTYFGGEKAVPGYNVMGICKAALDAAVRYLAYDLGKQGVRVNAISAGPIRTLAAAGVSGFKTMYRRFAEIAPLHENVGIEDVGGAAVFLCSDLSGKTTGQVLYVDSGYNILGISEPVDEPVEQKQEP